MYLFVHYLEMLSNSMLAEHLPRGHNTAHICFFPHNAIVSIMWSYFDKSYDMICWEKLNIMTTMMRVAAAAADDVGDKIHINSSYNEKEMG